MAKKLIRKIYISGEITQDSYDKFSQRLSRLEREGKTSVEIELSSEGGDAYAALAYASRMRLSPLKLIVKAYGLVASAAVMILAYGDARKMSSEAWVMVHEDAGAFEGDVTSAEKWSSQLRKHETQWSKLIATKTGTDEDVWESLHKETTYLTAEECLFHGLIDEVI